MSTEATLPEDEDESPRATSALGGIFVLSVAFCRAEPWRLGEVLLVPTETRGGPIVWGRGAGSDGTPRALLGQPRPGRWLPSPALSVAAISRQQLSLESVAEGRLRVTNLGRCPMFRNGEVTDQAELGAGDVLQLGKQLVFACAERTLVHDTSNINYPEFSYGRADAHGIVGESQSAWQLRRRVAFVAARGDHVLVHGPSGSGKELVARAIHGLSSRASKPMVARNAATLPELLVDAELYGNARNYPNPGMPERPGLVGEAHGSTLFLDEIAELPEQLQTHLLRVLDGGEHQRLGETRRRVSDFRLIAATNRELSALKHDLRARFALELTVPDLSDRWEDIPLLMRHLLVKDAERGDGIARGLFPNLDPRNEPNLPIELVTSLLASRPSNVRKLRAQLWEGLATRELGAEVGSTPSGAEGVGAGGGPAAARAISPHLEAQRIQRCLDEHNGVIEQTWRSLGLPNRFALVRLIRKYDLEVRRRARSSR